MRRPVGLNLHVLSVGRFEHSVGVVVAACFEEVLMGKTKVLAYLNTDFISVEQARVQYRR
jgi:hypothetical protein